MNMKAIVGVIGSGVLLCCVVWGGPSLPVTKPPVEGIMTLTGPSMDIAATNGQWFYNAQGVNEFRTHEFYDNTSGGTAGHGAIFGYVSGVTYLAGPGSPILGFSIEATISNDTVVTGGWLVGTNSHGEALPAAPSYAGEMKAVRMTVEFAVTDAANVPQPIVHPYRDASPYIVAVNEDQAAWYCWSPADPQQIPQGGFFVPAWDFGDIPAGQAKSRKLDFSVPGPGLQPMDPRYAVIVQSFTTGADVLLNRTTSLKISTWMDDPGLDTGVPYPEQEPLRGSDVSVFHNVVETEVLDFGDAPDPTYPTLLAQNGARHVILTGFSLGALTDAEPDGQPDAQALGDDLAGTDDEDGVLFPVALFPGVQAPVVVDAQVPPGHQRLCERLDRSERRRCVARSRGTRGVGQWRGVGAEHVLLHAEPVDGADLHHGASSVEHATEPGPHGVGSKRRSGGSQNPHGAG